jgi:hypothetical protein
VAEQLMRDPSRHLGAKRTEYLLPMRAIRTTAPYRRAKKARRREETSIRGIIIGMKHEIGGREIPLDSLTLQGIEAREEGGVRLDKWGRTHSDRSVWRSFLAGFALACAFVAGPARAAEVTGGELFPATPGVGPTVACTEPTTQGDGRPLGATLALGGLAGCFAAIKDNANVVAWEGWLRPPVPSGGARHDFGANLPLDVTRYPVAISCACYNAMGWSPSAVGRVSLVLIREGE